MNPNFLKYNQADPAWLDSLPGLVDRLAARWSLTVDPPFAGLSINYAAPAVRDDGARCVLKVSRYLDDTRNEIAALRLWDGVDAVRLLDADPAVGALLLERIEPGTLLVELAERDDDAATTIAAEVLSRLWRPAPEPNDLNPLPIWCAAYERNREALSRGDGGLPAHLFQRADALRGELLASTTEQTVLHGDLHHYNILRSERVPWLAIDPKGLVGDRHFDVCQFFRNPHDVPRGVNRRRLDIFCDVLGLDRDRTKAWCFVHAMLDACWDFEDGNAWQRAVAYAEETQTF